MLESVSHHYCLLRRPSHSTTLWWGDLREEDDLEDPVIDGWIILNASSRSGMTDMDCTDLAQDRDKWKALMNAIKNLQVL
jgi:hypothetical protein